MSSIWPVNDFAVSGVQLAKMYEALRVKDEKGTKEKGGKFSRDDLEDGEIDSEREARRDVRRDRDRDYRREEDLRREDRREERRDDPSRRVYPIEDRLSFTRKRDPDRERQQPAVRPWLHSSRSPRHTPY